MGRTLGIIAVKGGVGKTTIAASIAADLANHYGQKVLLVDANHTTPHIGTHMNIEEPTRTVQDVLLGKSSTLAALHKRFGVDVMPGDPIQARSANPFKLKNALSVVSQDYDFTIIDSAPTLGDETKAVLNATDGNFIITTPDEPTLHASIAATKMINSNGGKIHGIIVNRMRDKSFAFNTREIEKATGVPVVACLPDDLSVGRALFTQIPATVYKRSSSFSSNLTKLSSVLVGIRAREGFFESVFGFNKSPEAVNREILRNEFYSSIFEK